jgi:HK97 family phage prohead protease
MIPKTVNDKLNEGRSYRDIRVQELTTEEKAVEGYATTFNDPYELFRVDNYTVYEQIDPHAFDECDMSDTIMQYNHEGRVFARRSNGTLALRVDDVGLHIRADLGGTELGRQVYEEIVGGYTTKMSFGFVVGEDKREVTEDYENNTVTVLRTITKITKLYDVSAVSIPANDATSISARTYGEGVIAEVVKELHAREERERQRKRIKLLTEVL